MKTPREILLNRHRAVEPRLNAVRHEVITQFNRTDKAVRRPDSVFVSLGCGVLNKLWQELILPSRRIWAGLAAVWIALVAINLAQRESIPPGRVVSAPVQMSAREQLRLMNELFADRLPAADADRPRSFTPKPRTEISQTFTT